MIQFLLSALLVLVPGGIFVWTINKIFKHKPTRVKTTFGSWFAIEAEFETPASETRN